jgi:predicted RecB family nuclease
MKASAEAIRLAASDLSNHLACRHLTALDLDVVKGARSAPTWQSPDAWVLQQRGMEHEKAYLGHLAAEGVAICDLRDIDRDESAVTETVAAMERGVTAIAQATLVNGRWFGRADVLRRVERQSKLGEWSYEVYDCKLARETKAATILQLSLYSELLETIQGMLPESMYVVPPGESFHPEQYRVPDYAAYYRYVKSRLEAAVDENDRVPDTYPEPTSHCEICRWRPDCETERRGDDHLSLVAGISRLQRKQLGIWDTTTVADLARFPLPIRERPDHGSRDSYVRVREQARIQVAGREERRPVHEVLEITEGHGLSLLPEPSAGDVFFDLEGRSFCRSERARISVWPRPAGCRETAQVRVPLGTYASG